MKIERYNAIMASMALPEKKLTLPVILAIIGLLVQLFWIYLQVHHWREPNADYEAILINTVVTVALWGVLVYFIVTHRKAVGRSLRQELAGMIWVWWSSLADEYERLDYDNRTNTLTRCPFNHSSWPSYGAPWDYLHVRLYFNNGRAYALKQDTELLVGALGWKEHGKIPDPSQGTIMVDFIRQCREFQAYIEHKQF